MATIAFGLGLSLNASTARAQTTAGSEIHALRHDLALDVPVTSTALALVLASEIGKRDLVPQACRWCDRDASGDTLNGVDRRVRSAFRWSRPDTAARISDGIAAIVQPSIGFFGLWTAAAVDDATQHTGLDVLLVVEAVAVSGALNQLVKYIAVRERPYAHQRSLDHERAERHADDNLSFYSGHTSFAFSLGVSAATIATLRGYSLAPVVWGAALASASTTAYLRMAADRHYFSDVLTGAIVGSAIGVLVPVLFHGRSGEAAPLDELPGASSAARAAATPPTMMSFGSAF